MFVVVVVVVVVAVVGTQKVAFGGDSTFMVDDVKLVPLPEMGNCGRYGIGPLLA